MSKSSPTLNQYSFPNGLELIFKPMPGHKLVSVAIGIKNGVLSEKKSGLSHLVEHLVMYSCEFYIKKFLKSSSRSHWTSGASVYKGYSEFRFDMKNSLLTPLMDAVIYAFQNPIFNGKNIAREKKYVLKECEAQRNIDYGLADHLTDAAMFISPFSNPTVGKKEEVIAIKENDITAYWEKIRKAGNIKIVIAGDISESDLEKIKAAWTVIPGGEFSYSQESFLKIKRQKTTIGFLAQKKIFVNVIIPVLNWQFYDKFASIIISSAFAGATNSVLDGAFKKLKGVKNLGAGIFEFQKTAYLTISFYSPPDKSNQALTVLAKLWLGCCKEAPPKNTLISIKKIAKQLYGETIASASLTAQMILYEKMYAVPGKQILLPERQLELIFNVTQDEIPPAIKAFASIQDWSIVLVGAVRDDPIKPFWKNFRAYSL